MNHGIITLEIEGLSPRDIERLRLILHRIILQGVLNIKTGEMSIHFQNSELMTIEVLKRWRKSDEPATVHKSLDRSGTTDRMTA